MSPHRALIPPKSEIFTNKFLLLCLIAGFISLVIVAGLLIATPAISLIYSTIGSDLSNACQSMGGGSGC